MEPPSPGAEPSGLKGEILTEEPDRVQRAIARRTAETRAIVPDLELQTEVEMDAALALVAQPGRSLTAILVRAVALALRDHPRVNAAYRDGRFELYSRVNVGVVLHTPDAYAIPTVLDADTKPVPELTAELQALRARAQAGELTPPELAGATFTLADLSDLGVDRWSALVTPPHAAAMSAGAVRAVPVVREGSLVAAHTAALTLACDHRILFGTRAAAFLHSVAQRLTRGAL